MGAFSTPAISLFLGRVSTFPLLLIVCVSLSPAWAHAFNSVAVPSIATTTSVAKATDFSRRTFSSPSILTASVVQRPHIPMKSSNPPPSFLSLLFLRGGQQDEDTVATDDSSSLDTDTQPDYGTHTSDVSVDEESDSASVEMRLKSPIELEPTSPVTKPPKSLVSSSVVAPISSLLHVAAAFYTQQLLLRPVLTKSLTAGIIFGFSDWCAQLIEKEKPSDETQSKEPIVFSRILTSFLVGLIFFGPAANAWYAMIFRILPSNSLMSTLQKAALGQIIFGPMFTCVFFGAGMIQSGTFSFGNWLRKIQKDLPGVWASGLGFWPAVDFVSYKIIPVQWIPLFVNFCSFVWTIYLSLVANRAKSVNEWMMGDRGTGISEVSCYWINFVTIITDGANDTARLDVPKVHSSFKGKFVLHFPKQRYCFESS